MKDTHRLKMPHERLNAKTGEREKWNTGDIITPFKSELSAMPEKFELIENEHDELQPGKKEKK